MRHRRHHRASFTRRSHSPKHCVANAAPAPRVMRITSPLSPRRKSVGKAPEKRRRIAPKAPPSQYHQPFFQTAGVTSMSMGYSSRRPASISNMRIYLVTGCMILKLQVGPTLERPGPMLLKVQATDVKMVSRS